MPPRPAPPGDATQSATSPALDPQRAARHAEAAVHADIGLREAEAAHGADTGGANPAVAKSHLNNAVEALAAARSLLGDEPDEATRSVIARADAIVAAARDQATAVAPSDATPAADDENLNATQGGADHVQAPDPSLARGTASNAVRTAQHLLRSHGAAMQVTGKFDAATDTAVRTFQRDHQLPTTGVIDATTWAVLRTDPTPGRQAQTPPSSPAAPIAAQPAPAQLPTAPPAPPTAPPPDPAPPVRNYYTVVRGDTLSAIETKTGVKVARLKQLNGLTDSTIYVGEQLRLNDQVTNKVHRKPATQATPPPPQPPTPPAPKETHEAPISECADVPLPVPGSVIEACHTSG